MGGASSGVPFAARGPPYFKAGLRISPDFFRINRAEYGEGMDADCGPDRGAVELRGMIPVKSSLSPVFRRPWCTGRSLSEAEVTDSEGGEMVEVVERVLGVRGEAEAEWMMELSVVSDVSDRARMGERRGRKLPGDPEAGPMWADESSDCETAMGVRSGETLRDEAAESPELSGSSVKPNNLGRRPRCCAIRSESVAISSARRGGDLTSGRTCMGSGMPLVIE